MIALETKIGKVTTMKELHLLGKLVKLENCPVLMDFQPDANWQDTWQVMAGEW